MDVDVYSHPKQQTMTTTPNAPDRKASIAARIALLSTQADEAIAKYGFFSGEAILPRIETDYLQAELDVLR